MNVVKSYLTRIWIQTAELSLASASPPSDFLSGPELSWTLTAEAPKGFIPWGCLSRGTLEGWAWHSQEVLRPGSEMPAKVLSSKEFDGLILCFASQRVSCQSCCKYSRCHVNSVGCSSPQNTSSLRGRCAHLVPRCWPSRWWKLTWPGVLSCPVEWVFGGSCFWICSVGLGWVLVPDSVRFPSRCVLPCYCPWMTSVGGRLQWPEGFCGALPTLFFF